MTRTSDEELRVHQREVQRLFGQCLLRLQAYERGMKAVLAQHDIFWSAESLARNQAVSEANTGGKTLGALVNHVLESFLTTDEKARSAKAMPDPAAGGTGCGIRTRIQIGLSDDDFAQVENGLRALVLMRNNLVHHFLEQHDLESLDGCQKAEAALLADSDRIKPHFDQLREWAEEIERTRLHAAEVFNAGPYRDLITALIVDGTIPWPFTAIVGALREAAAALGGDGWAPVAQAVEWISMRYSEEVPENYGCRSWPHVLQESRCFELQYRLTGRHRVAWYRARNHDLSAEAAKESGSNFLGQPII